jgi:hypothetical protein
MTHDFYIPIYTKAFRAYSFSDKGKLKPSVQEAQ